MIEMTEEDKKKEVREKGVQPTSNAPNDAGCVTAGDESDEKPKGRGEIPYQWPSIYDECVSMVGASTLVYGICDVRNAIRSGKISDPEIVEAFMNVPMDLTKLMEMVVKRKDVFEKIFSESDLEMYHDVTMQQLENVYQQTKKVATNKDLVSEVGDPELQLVELDDENCYKEMVYSIVVNKDLRRIDVVFRGSVTPRDFVADADPLMGHYTNPVQSIPGYEQEKTIGIHLGFAGYLNGTPLKLGEGKCRVIKDRLLALLKDHPGYMIYTTGHSLGGALATLMAFEAATMPEIPKPVTCISVASPKVGNISFRHAVQALEKQGHLRCLRVANKLDIITNLPTEACCVLDRLLCCITSFFQHHRYWHVGIKLILHRSGKCDLSYDSKRIGYLKQIEREMLRRGMVHQTGRNLLKGGHCGQGDGDLLKNHSTKEYVDRLDAVRSELELHSMQELYTNKKFRRMSVKPPKEMGL